LYKSLDQIPPGNLSETERNLLAILSIDKDLQ
jgi:hypothetical protein